MSATYSGRCRNAREQKPCAWPRCKCPVDLVYWKHPPKITQEAT